MTTNEENQIVERVLQGKREAFAALVDAHKGTIFNLAFRMTGNHQDADDLSQETFIRAYRNLRQFDPRKRFFTWIYTIGLNLIRNHLKKHGREMTRENAARSSSEAGIDQGAQTERDVVQAPEIRRLEICLHEAAARPARSRCPEILSGPFLRRDRYDLGRLPQRRQDAGVPRLGPIKTINE